MSEEETGQLLHDLAYVRTCIEKTIERVPEDYKFDGENAYYHVEMDCFYKEVVGVEPACLVGQILGDVGVDESLQSVIAMYHNGQSIRDLVKAVGLPIDEPAVEFLHQVQQLNDEGVPWHRILEELPA